MTDAEERDLIESLAGKTVSRVHVHLDEDSVEWFALSFSDGTEIEISAHGMHTEGWVVVNSGRELRDIYHVEDETVA